MDVHVSQVRCAASPLCDALSTYCIANFGACTQDQACSLRSARRRPDTGGPVAHRRPCVCWPDVAVSGHEDQRAQHRRALCGAGRRPAGHLAGAPPEPAGSLFSPCRPAPDCRSVLSWAVRWYLALPPGGSPQHVHHRLGALSRQAPKRLMVQQPAPTPSPSRAAPTKAGCGRACRTTRMSPRCASCPRSCRWSRRRRPRASRPTWASSACTSWTTARR